jgi:hypothetical protein
VHGQHRVRGQGSQHPHNRLFNSNDAPTAFAKATIILEQYSEFGAADSEPYQVLRELHDLFFADELQQDFRCV